MTEEVPVWILLTGHWLPWRLGELCGWKADCRGLRLQPGGGNEGKGKTDEQLRKCGGKGRAKLGSSFCSGICQPASNFVTDSSSGKTGLWLKDVKEIWVEGYDINDIKSIIRREGQAIR